MILSYKENIDIDQFNLEGTLLSLQGLIFFSQRRSLLENPLVIDKTT